MKRFGGYSDINRFADIFYKLSALRWPEETKWVPKEFKGLNIFKKYPKEQPEKIFTEYGINDFADDIIIKPSSAIAAFYNRLKVILDEVDTDLLEYDLSELGLNDQNTLTMNAALNKYVLENPETLRLTRTIKSNNIIDSNKIQRFDEGTSIIKIYNAHRQNLAKLFYRETPHMPKIEKLEEFKNLSIIGAIARKGKLIFSTQINDLVGVASRGIRSCQSLFGKDEKEFSTEEYVNKLSGTILSKYVGVIYVTTGSNFMGRGTRMLYRSLVRIIYDVKTNKPIIFIDKMYPRPTAEVSKMMKEALSKRTTLPIIDINENPEKIEAGLHKEFYIMDEDEIPEEYEGYKDVELSRSVDYYIKELKAGEFGAFSLLCERAPEKLLEVKEHLTVKMRINLADKIPRRHLAALADGEESEPVLRVIVSRMGDHPEFIISLIRGKEHSYLLEDIVSSIYAKNYYLLLPKYKELNPSGRKVIIKKMPLNQPELAGEMLKYEISKGNKGLINEIIYMRIGVGKTYYDILPEDIKKRIS
jgi:hypothetical protein